MFEIEKNWYPEGVERCTLGRFFIWIACISPFFLWGGYAAYHIFGQGLGVTEMNNYFAFGLWITFDLAVIALGAGAFFTGLLRYIFRIDELKNILNLAVIVGFVCYSGAILILLMEIGQPLRSWFGYWHANVHSMLTEVIFCITCYLLIVSIEFIPIILGQRQLHRLSFPNYFSRNLHIMMPLLAALGAFLSTFHQGSLGGMYGVMFARPFSFREGFFIWPWTFFLFIISAIASGPSFIVLITTLMEKVTGRRLVSFDIKALLGKISGWVLCIYLVFKLADTFVWLRDLLPAAGVTFAQQFKGLLYGQWLLFVELAFCGILPALLLVIPAWRNRPRNLYLAMFLVCTGVVLNRYIFTVQTLAVPVLPFDQWEFYIPNWAEWAPTLMVIAYGALVLSLAYRYLPVFPQEKELNSRP